MVLADSPFKMEITLKEFTKMINHMERVSIIGRMDLFMMDNFVKDLAAVLVC